MSFAAQVAAPRAPASSRDRGTYHRGRPALLLPTRACTRSARGFPQRWFLPGHFVNSVSVLHTETVHDPSLQPALRECVVHAIRRYLSDMDSEPPEGLYAMVVGEVELPLLREVLHWCGGNQSKAASALGINRATLRKKLRQYGVSSTR
jgi:Fis family transcriptional regulator